jgi:hypothetical protein
MPELFPSTYFPVHGLPHHSMLYSTNNDSVVEELTKKITNKKTKLRGLSPQANYIDRLSDCRLSAKLVPTLADRGCRVVSATIPPTVVSFGFLDRSRYFLEIAPQLSSRG